MSRQAAKDLVFGHLASFWSRAPLVPEGLKGRFQADDPGACALFTPEGVPPFTPMDVLGTVSGPGVGYAVVGFDEGETEDAFQGGTGWELVDLYLVVDHFTPELHGHGTAEESDRLINQEFYAWAVRGDDGTIAKYTDPDRRQFLTFPDEDGWHRHQTRVPLEAKIYKEVLL